MQSSIATKIEKNSEKSDYYQQLPVVRVLLIKFWASGLVIFSHRGLYLYNL